MFLAEVTSEEQSNPNVDEVKELTETKMILNPQTTKTLHILDTSSTTFLTASKKVKFAWPSCGNTLLL